MTKQYLKLLQKRIGYLAIGPSTLRNQGAPGVIAVARNYLQGMSLSCLRDIDSETKYLRYLQKHTAALAKKFPPGATGNWGAARKAINIFIRDCLYNRYLSQEYGIYKLEKWLEIPLDGDVARQLMKNRPDPLPPWKSIKCLDPATSDRYQAAAEKLARAEGVARVHLDIKYWRSGR